MNVAIMTTIIEFQILKRDFMDLSKFKTLRMLNQLKSLVKRHNQLFDDVKNLEEIFSFKLFLNFYSMAFVVCFTAFQASTSTDAAELIGMAFYCISGLFGIFVQSYFGDLLKNVSENVLFGLFECGWENMTMKDEMEVRRQLPFILKRACIPAKLTCLKIADVSLYQFANVRFSFF